MFTDMDKDKSDFKPTFTYIPPSKEEAEQITKGLEVHSKFKSAPKLLKSNNKIVAYFVTIFLTFVVFTVVTLPVTFIAQIFGFCLVPITARNIQCSDLSNLGFIMNSVMLGEVAAFFAILSPIIRLLNKPISFSQKK